MSKFEDKNRYTIFMHPENMDKVDAFFKNNGCESRSEFIERAVKFYCGYLAMEQTVNYLPDVLITTIGAKLELLEERMSNLLFKMAVELAMVLHVTAATNEIDENTLSGLRGMCVEEVKKLRGSLITFDKAFRFQKG